MKIKKLFGRSGGAFTLVEMLVATGLGSVVLVVIAILAAYGARSFVALGNYADLDQASRNALDLISVEMRQATALVSVQTNATAKSLTFTNALTARQMKIYWDSSSRLLNMDITGQGTYPLLTECDRWDFSLYSKATTVTSTNVVFYPATNNTGAIDPTICKLVNMSWKCSRTILGNKVNTESVQTAQIVLRNKVK
jgi:type II secretory pathway pseudopilin PulG